MKKLLIVILGLVITSGCICPPAPYYSRGPIMAPVVPYTNGGGYNYHSQPVIVPWYGIWNIINPWYGGHGGGYPVHRGGGYGGKPGYHGGHGGGKPRK